MKATKVVVCIAMVAGALAPAFLLRTGTLPRGVPGEWEWSLLALTPSVAGLTLAVAGVILYAIVAALGMKSLQGKPGRAREIGWVGALVAASVAGQIAATSGAPEAYGLEKWVTLAIPGSSGYFKVADEQIDDLWQFWAEYPEWIVRQDALHVGTHPPGLFLGSEAMLSATSRSPGLSRAVLRSVPTSVSLALREMMKGAKPSDRAAVVLMAMLTLILCASTVAPLYWLARSMLSPAHAWAAASLWPLAPSAVMFGPTADTAFPFLATLILGLASLEKLVPACVAGLMLAVGMQFTLAFLPVGLGVAILHSWRPPAEWKRSASLLLATGLGFLSTTLGIWVVSSSNPFAIWLANASNHARFYREYPRSYLAWNVVNPIELTIGLGVPAVLLGLIGLTQRPFPRPAVATLAVLVALSLSGKNLSEVGRLWLPLMPALLVASGAGIKRLNGGPVLLGIAVVSIGASTLLLESTIQVVYPI